MKTVLKELTSFRRNPVIGDGTRYVGGEIGYVQAPEPGSKSRADVLGELEQFRHNPVLAVGAVYVGGQAGYVYPPHAATFPTNPVRRTRTGAQLGDPHPTITEYQK